MRLNLFGRAFAALLAGLAGVCRWPTPSTAAGTWIRSSVMPLYRHGKTDNRARKSRSRYRMRQRHGA